MKRIILGVLALLCMANFNAFAYDVAAVNADGLTIYYNYINNDTELEVTREKLRNSSYHGMVNIPGTVTVEGKTLLVTSIGEMALAGGPTAVVIPNTVTTIGRRAFSLNPNLVTVTLPSSVTSIGEEAFYNCTSISSINIPDGVTIIRERAFQGCSRLASVTIHNSLKTIGENAFRDCSSLTKLVLDNEAMLSKDFDNAPSIMEIFGEQVQECVLGEHVTSIRNFAFSLPNLASITIPSSVKSIGYFAFDHCYGLTSVHISDLTAWCGMERFPEDYYANPFCAPYRLYLNDEEIKDLVIPGDVTSLGKKVFGGCSSLTRVVIPNSLTMMDVTALDNCQNLTDIYCYADMVQLNGYVLGKRLLYVTLHVPASSLDAYRNAEGWRHFENIVPLKDSDPAPTGMISPTTSRHPAIKECYNMNGHHIRMPQRGLIIVKRGDGTTKKYVMRTP